MSFTLATFARVSASYNTAGWPMYTYVNTDDTGADMAADGYFDGQKRILRQFSLIWAQAQDVFVSLQVQSVSPTVTTIVLIQDLSPDSSPTFKDLLLDDTGVGVLASSTILNIDSKTRGVAFPQMLQTERDAIATPKQGLMIHNSDTNKLNIFENTAWEIINDDNPILETLQVGTGTIASSTIVNIDSTTQGVAFPVLTTAERDAIATPKNGLMIYNGTTSTLNIFAVTVWKEFTIT